MKIGKFESLKLRKELSEIKRSQNVVKHPLFSIKFLKKTKAKVAFSISKKLANSVVRNKIKRKFRAILMKMSPEPIHFLFVVNGDIFSIKHIVLEQLIDSQIKKCLK